MSFQKKSRLYEILVSFFVCAILVAQAGVVLGAILEVPGISGRKFWPIITYHMYSQSRFEGDTIEVHDLLEAVRTDGTVVPISEEDLGLNLWDYRHLMRDLKAGEERSVWLFQTRYADWAGLTELRVMSYPLMLTRDGPADKPSEILARIPLNSHTTSVKSE